MWLWNLRDNRKEKHSVLSIVLVYSPLPQCQEHVTPVQEVAPITDTQSQLPLPLPCLKSKSTQQHQQHSLAFLDQQKGMAFSANSLPNKNFKKLIFYLFNNNIFNHSSYYSVPCQNISDSYGVFIPKSRNERSPFRGTGMIYPGK